MHKRAEAICRGTRVQAVEEGIAVMALPITNPQPRVTPMANHNWASPLTALEHTIRPRGH